MSLCKYVKEIESLRFQIQFSVVGGMEILQLAMEQQPTLVALRSEISKNAQSADAVFERIVVLLTKVETETQLSYDESIAAYLFCLFKEKPISAYRASWRIIEHGGLWWSVQLAHHVKDCIRELVQSIDTSSGIKEYDTYPTSNRTADLAKDIYVVSRKFDAICIRSNQLVKQLSFPQLSSEDATDSRDKITAKRKERLGHIRSSVRPVELMATD
ncbi:MAG: hypothetical protein OXG60_10650 [Chloroflexi bacterium]|nr:hypothetical protein [Chloroflexota bacterium]